jgi:hypothetical protein
MLISDLVMTQGWLVGAAAPKTFRVLRRASEYGATIEAPRVSGLKVDLLVRCGSITDHP